MPMLDQVYICDTAHDRLEKLVIFLQHGREKAGRGPEVVEEFREGKRMSHEEDSILGRELFKPVTHPLQHANLHCEDI